MSVPCSGCDTTTASQYEEVSLSPLTKCFLFDSKQKCLSFKGRKSVKWKEQMPRRYLDLVWHTDVYLWVFSNVCAIYAESDAQADFFFFSGHFKWRLYKGP